MFKVHAGLVCTQLWGLSMCHGLLHINLPERPACRPTVQVYCRADIEQEQRLGCWPSTKHRQGRIQKIQKEGAKNSGAPNDGFLPNALKRCFRLSGVFLKLCRLILGCAIKFLSVGFSSGTVGFPNLLGLFCPFPENLRSYFLSENPS